MGLRSVRRSPLLHTLTARYFAQGEVRNGHALLYARNALGSVIDTLTTQGQIQTATAYSPYGTPKILIHTIGTQSSFGYAGLFTDASTGLNLTLYRAYDPSIRRWLSRDPYGQRAALRLLRKVPRVQSALSQTAGVRGTGLHIALNAYSYVGNDPQNWVDPDGDLPRAGPWLRFGCMVWAFCGSHRIDASRVWGNYFNPIRIEKSGPACKLKPK